MSKPLKFNSLLNILGMRHSSKKNLRKVLGELIDEGIVKKEGKHYLIKTENQESTEEIENKYAVGTLEKFRNYFYVLPDSKSVKKNIYINPKRVNNAVTGDKVYCEIFNPEDIDSRYSELEGRIIKSFGKAGEIKAEAESILVKYGFTRDFPENVETEAEKIKEQSLEELETLMKPKQNYKFTDVYNYLQTGKSKKVKISEDGRINLTGLKCFTVDPEDAKDYDDAVSTEKQKDGFIIGVHIADVSYYVKEGSKVDLEALKRSTSVYLVNQVSPMLPEALSNELCSLKPGKEKYTFSVLIKLDKNYKVSGYYIFKSVIENKRRYDYEEVQNIIEKKIKDNFSNTIILMNKIAKELTIQRLNSGGIDFESREIKYVFDKKGNVSDLKNRVRLDSMRMVEEFMLIANRCVTEFVTDLQEQNKTRYPFVYRVHDYPDSEKLKDLSEFIKQFGHRIDLKNKNEIKKLIESIKGRPEEYIINSLLIRSMAKAIYTEENIGHYGLGFDDYTHFTSPIRRYPDLVVHRILKEYLYNKQNTRKVIRKYSKSLADICKHSSKMEQNAMSAERDVNKLMQAQFLSGQIGNEYEGIISGIVSQGFFVELIDFPAEGMVRFKDIPDDYYEFDEKKHYVKGRRHKKIFRAGDRINVVILSSDTETRKIDFGIA
ncbi:MAG: VacB/RNase II family 3'-5' exoribonuclease [Ignavibacteria bacterium]|nr:VacB/RNase II family 3'-5' exoribonuclease [Ignavibacteria bacterium]